MIGDCPLVAGFDERPQQAYRQGLDARGDQVVDRGDHPVDVERDDHFAVHIDALGNRADILWRNDRRVGLR